jgi:hypothetical protein
MAASAWRVPGRTKRNLGRGTIVLHTGVFKMSLHRSSASAVLAGSLSVGGISAWQQVIAELTNGVGNYTKGGKSVPAAKWSTGVSNKVLKFYYTTGGIVFTGSGAALNNIRYAVVRMSGATTSSGSLVCYAALSTAMFTINSGNTLTILPATNGVFQLA